MQKEMEEADRNFALSIGQGARLKVFDELRCRMKEDNIAEIEGKIVAKKKSLIREKRER